MSDPKEADVRAILQAIEYGRLPPHETQRRLLAMIQAEANRTDAPAICWNGCKVNKRR